MAVTKRSEFDQTEIELADLAKAISHPARVAILNTLAERNECICGEIVQVLPLAQSTVSQHLKELKNAGLVKGTIDGPKSCYCINWSAFERFEQILQLFFAKAQSQKDNNKCC
jgi:DNA-binding transcriptional ArsR family regulator